MELTQALKDWAIENLGVATDATDDDFLKAITAAVVDGKIDAAKLAELTAKEEDPREELGKMIAAANAPIADAITKMAEAVGKLAEQKAAPAQPETDLDAASDLIGKMASQEADRVLGERNGNGTTPTIAEQVIAETAGASPRVKSAIEGYQKSRTALVHPEKTKHGVANPKAGQPARWMSKQLESGSQADMAVIGAFIRWQRFSQPGLVRRPLNQHEKDLVQYALHELKWTGTIGHEEGPGIDGRKLEEFERKAILDDTTSGGAFSIPTLVEEQFIVTPLLHGELLPHVNTEPTTRSTVRARPYTDFDWTWGSTEGTTFSLVSTAGLITNLDTNIFPAVAAIKIGQDAESDMIPPDLGAHIVERTGQKLMETLDEQIAIGDGTQEPTGIFTASGVTSIPSASGTSSALVPADIESLLWGLAKAMRNLSPGSVKFVMNDTTFRRIAGTAVGSNDARRVFFPNFDQEKYTLMFKDVKIQNSIPNGSLAAVNLSFYKLYRRLGMTFRRETGGQTLALQNSHLLIFRARYGGQPTLGSSISKMTDGPTSVTDP